MSEPTEPIVSVVIPTYNHAEFLREALASVVNQTEQHWEALVINNFSDDHTESVIASFSDTRIKLVNFRNQGVIAASRNVGIREARGDFVAFLDSDDRWAPEKLRTCIQHLQSGPDLVCHSERWFGDGIAEKIVYYGPQSRGTFDSLLYQGNALSTSAVVVRREHLLSCSAFSEDPEIVTAEDYDLWLRLAQRGTRISFIDEVLGEFRLHANSQSRGIERNFSAEVAVLGRCYASLPAPDSAEQSRRARRLAIAHYTAGRNFQKVGAHTPAAKHLLRAIRIYPWLPKPWIALALNLTHNLKHQP